MQILSLYTNHHKHNRKYFEENYEDYDNQWGYSHCMDKNN